MLGEIEGLLSDLTHPSPSYPPDTFPLTVPKEPHSVELDVLARTQILKVIEALRNHKAPRDGFTSLANSFSKTSKTLVNFPFYKKEDKTERKNYNRISLMDIVVKTYGLHS